jgi:DNA polymerase I-like protein with 3'-5' exonuclease and polymerase domains
MRTDNIGLFWKDEPKEKGGQIRDIPKIPKTGWKTPHEFPNLSSCKTLAIDTETYDPNLLTHGPGWARGDGHIVGVSVAANAKNAWYFPMRHEVKGKHNLPAKKVLKWLASFLGKVGVTKLGANLQYDLGWLMYEGVYVAGPFIDVLFAEALINESKFKYDLDTTARDHLGIGKVNNKLYKWCARFYGGKIDGTQRANIYRAPPSLVGPYAEGDVTLPFQIYKKQYKVLKKEKLLNLFNVESRLIPLMLAMRKRGVRVDIDKAEKARDRLLKREEELQNQIHSITGKFINVNASGSIKDAFVSLGLPYNLTEKGNPSFTAAFLNAHPHKIADLIVSSRQVQKARSTFLEGYILDKNVNGRIHCEFPQLKGDGGGTVSGRYSSRNPNLQNIPARDTESKRIIRGCFVPDEGFDWWGSFDLSQIEYRFLAHFAVGQGAKLVRKMYKNNPETDFHETIKILIHEIVEILLTRKTTKSINFGLVYGMGKSTLASNLGLSQKESNKLMKAYHIAVPFVRETFNYYMEQAQIYGVMRTVLGRQSRFNLWESRTDYQSKALPYKSAYNLYGPGNMQRANTYKSLNRLLQGSSADYLKTAMLRMYEDGVFDSLGGAPHLTVHDELDVSFCESDMEAVKELRHIMDNAIKLRVPVFSDFKVGKNWGELEDYAE